MKKLLILSLMLSSILLVACSNKTESTTKNNETTVSVKYETSLIRNDVREIEGNALILNNYNIILDWTKQDSGWGLVENTKPITFVGVGGTIGVYVQENNQIYKVDYTKGLENWGIPEGVEYIKDTDILYRAYSYGDTEIIAKNVDKIYNNKRIYTYYDVSDVLYNVLDDKTSLYNIIHEKVLDLKEYNISVDDIAIIKGNISLGNFIIVTDDNVFIKPASYAREDEILQYKEMEKAIKELQQKAKIKDVQWDGGTVAVTVLLENEELYRIELIR